MNENYCIKNLKLRMKKINMKKILSKSRKYMEKENVLPA